MMARAILRIKKFLLSDLFCAIFYIAMYRLMHKQFLMEYFSHMGYVDCSHSFFAELMTDFLAILPICFYNRKNVSSNLVAIFIYIFVYVPTLITLQYSSAIYWDIFAYQLVFCFSITSFMLCAHFGNIFIEKSTTEKGLKSINYISTDLIVKIGLILVLFVVLSYGSSLRLVSLYDVYDLRDENHKVQIGNPLLGYFVLWLTYFFIPFFAGIGLFQKQKKYVVLSFLIALLIYSSVGAKVAIFAPFFSLFLYYILTRIGFKYFFQAVISSFSFIILIAISIDIKNYPVLFDISGVLLLRTLSISGLLAPAYISFFEAHDYIYYGHVSFVGNIFGTYPYKETLGKVVWGWYRGLDPSDAMNANANFLFTDGISALGIVGVVIITIVFCLILIYLNKVTVRHNKNFVFVLLIGSVMALTNVSLFTSLISYGLLFVILYFRYSTPDFEKKLK